MDGKYGLNENGPMRGKPVELNWLMVADNPGAAERVACKLMQVPLESVPHLRYAQKLGLIPRWSDIGLSCGLEPFLKEKFHLKRAFANMPGFLAFNSSWLAWVAYFSPCAEILHKILYLFRDPFYDYQKYGCKGK